MSRRKGASGKQNEPKRFTRESKAVPAPGANAELLSSIQVSYESIEAYVCSYSYKPMLLYLIA